MRHYQRDPYWLECVKYKGVCSRCGGKILKGEKAFYFPNGKSILCKNDDCSGQASRDFDAIAFDDYNMSGM